jgi:hypothetical protein
LCTGSPTIPEMIRKSHGIHGDATNSVRPVPQLTRIHWMYSAIFCPVYTYRSSPTFLSSPIISGAKRRYVISAIYPVRSTRQAMPFECDVTVGTYVTTDLSRQQLELTHPLLPTTDRTMVRAGHRPKTGRMFEKQERSGPRLRAEKTSSELSTVSLLVEIKCINVRRNTTVFSNCWRKLHVSALFWVGHHQVEIRIWEKTHIIQCGHQEWGNEISFYMFGEVCSYIDAMWNQRWLRLYLSCLISTCIESHNGDDATVSCSIVGAFAKLRKANMSFVMTVCPSVHKQQFGSQWKDFH